MTRDINRLFSVIPQEESVRLVIMFTTGSAMPGTVAIAGAIGIARIVMMNLMIFVIIINFMSEPLSDRYTSSETKVA